MRSTLAAGILALVATSAAAGTFRWAGTTEPLTMDPRAVNSAPVPGFAHRAETLQGGDDAGAPNRFSDVRVRVEVATAINVDAILQTIMRGSAAPAAQLVSPVMRGYPVGLSVGLKCPNDRYPNDEAVFQAVASMLAQIGLVAELDAMPVRNHWPELREGDFDMCLLGWSPGTFDAEHPIRFLATPPDAEPKLGSWNFGGSANLRIDELLLRIQSEIDDSARQAMLDTVAAILPEQAACVTLCVQPPAWGARETVELTQRPDNLLILRWVTVI